MPRPSERKRRRPLEARPLSYSVGLGLTNECNLSCGHCYRPGGDVQRLELADVDAICDAVPVHSVNLGTGENGLHPRFEEIVRSLLARRLRVSLTSNGYTLLHMPDELLRQLHDVEVSIDFPTAEEQDAFRGAGSFDTVTGAIARCRRLGLPVTVIAVMMNTNYRKLADIARLAAQFGARFRFNVYQPVNTDKYSLSYEQFWDGFRSILSQTYLVSCTEPLVAAVLGLRTVHGSPCGGTSLRLTPGKRVMPCVYWPDGTLALGDLRAVGPNVVESEPFRLSRTLPEACTRCELVAICRGGCASRRAITGSIEDPDPFCPIVRGELLDLPLRRREGAAAVELLHAKNYCTTIVDAAP
ncbi:MAG: radical SAM protein [Planctomycetes bacterium]|nr:radical SAM protein [Planctomycetota bacterium]MBI3844083.1 radical SAM protein [Planctomycetota bacterium]